MKTLYVVLALALLSGCAARQKIVGPDVYQLTKLSPYSYLGNSSQVLEDITEEAKAFCQRGAKVFRQVEVETFAIIPLIQPPGARLVFLCDAP